MTMYCCRNAPNLWYAPEGPLPSPQARPEVDRGRSIYDDRKQYYINSQSALQQQPSSTSRDHLRQPLSIPPPPQQQAAQPPPQQTRSNDDVQLRRENVVRELNHRNSYLQTKSDPNVPDPDYSPPMPRANPFDNRPQLRSALRTSRF